MSKINELSTNIMFEVLSAAYMTFVNKAGSPLLLVPLMGIVNKIRSPMIRIHLLKQKAVGDLARPFKGGLEGLMSSFAKGLPREEPEPDARPETQAEEEVKTAVKKDIKESKEEEEEEQDEEQEEEEEEQEDEGDQDTHTVEMPAKNAAGTASATDELGNGESLDELDDEGVDVNADEK